MGSLCMDRKMETRPAALIEAIVRVLTPPVSREYVLGDLSERYVSPRSYILDAFRTIPFVIASRIRRSIDPAWFLLGVLFIWSVIFWGPFQPTWLAGIIPTVVCSVVLLLRDAYRAPGKKPWIAAFGDVAEFVAAAVVSQGVLALVAPPWRLDLNIQDSAFGLLILLFMRLQIPAGLFERKTPATSITMGELTGEIRFYESTIRRAVRIEIGACCVVVFAALLSLPWLSTLESTPLAKVAFILTISAVIFVGVFMFRYCRVRSIPTDRGFEQAVAAYQEDMKYRCRLSANYVWWYLLPLCLGPTIFTVASASAAPVPFPALALMIAVTILGMVLFGALLIWIQRRLIRRTRERIHQLSEVTEKI